MKDSKSTQDWQLTLGQQVRTLRLLQNLDQRVLAERAGIGVTALKNLEHGRGAYVETLIRVLRALDRAQWIESLAPAVSVSPLQMVKTRAQRQRASSRKRARTARDV
jgi:transcriptional regulator with XRE-family HTH domain